MAEPGTSVSRKILLIDTSVWVAIFRETELATKLEQRISTQPYGLTRFNQLELLQGARDEKEWEQLCEYLDSQFYFECTEETWNAGARIYFDLRRAGKTVRSPIDCCIAQLAIENDVVLLHRDRDFETIAEVRELRQEWFPE